MTPTVGETRVYHLRNSDPCDTVRFDKLHYELLDRDRPIRPVRTKPDFYRRFYAGEFGNHGPIWPTFDAYWDSEYDAPIAIRTLKPGGPCQYNIARKQSREWLQLFNDQGWHELNFSAMAPTEKTVIQGEAQLGLAGLEIFVARVALPMRDALRQAGESYTGASATTLLRSLMDGHGFDWLTYLLDSYEDHVVEFSTFSVSWGVVPGARTVFWEVRSY